MKTVLEFMGLDPGRVRFSWVSAGEGEKFAQVITKVTEDVRRLGPARKLVKNIELPEMER